MHPLSAEAALERPRGRRSPAVAAVVARAGAAAVCRGKRSHMPASRWIAGDEGRLGQLLAE